MAVSYPRQIPAYLGVSELTMVIQRSQVVAQTRGGLVQAAERGRSLWRVSGTVSISRPEQFDGLLAWFDSLRGSLNTFQFYNIGRQRPIAYPGDGWAGFTRHGGGAFNGTATVTAASGYGVTIGALPSQYIVSEGDMISWPWRSTRTLHRVVEGGTAVNGVVSVQVEPDVPAGGTLPQTIQLERAVGIFRLINDDQRAPKYLPSYGDGFSFEAVQALF